VERVEEVAAIEGCGLAGDRYCEGTGHWSRFGRVCQVTLVAAEDLDAIEKETGIRVRDGEHRRNVVLRGVNLGDLRRRRFRIGGAGRDIIQSRDIPAVKDYVGCGSGVDQVYADKADIVSGNCEKVSIR
jgi:hypothetical protein